MFIPVALIWLWLPQVRAAVHPAPVAHHAAPVKVGPKTAEDLQRDLDAALRGSPFAGDHVTSSIAGQDITVSGDVHTAEDKGVATRIARGIAVKDGWKAAHVYSRVAVRLPNP